MVGKNNKKLLMEMGANKFKRYTLKKLSIGVASVSIGIGLMFGATEQVSAQAEAGTVIEHDEPVNQDITPQSEQQEPEIDHVLEAKRQEVNAYLVNSNLQHNRDQFKAQIDQATSVSELVNIGNQINEAVAEQVEETEKNNQLSEEEQEQKPQDTQVSDEKQSEELEKKRKAVKDELGKSEIVIWDDYLALLNKINEATSIEELDAISAEIRGDKAPEKQDEKEQEADNTIEQTTPATPQQPQVDVQQDTSKPEVEYTLDQVRHFFNQEEIAKIEAGQMTIKQALQKALGTQPDIKTNQNHHEENVLAAGVENLDNKQEEQTGKRRTRRNTGNVDLNRQFNRDDTFMHIFDYLDDLKNKKYLTEEETVIFKRGALRRFANNGDPDLRNDRADARKWETFLRSGQTSHLSRGAENQLKQKLSVRSGDISKLNEIIKKVQQFIKNRQGTNEHLIVDGTDSTNKQTRHELSPDLGNINISQGKTNSHQVTMELKKENPADWNNREYGYDIYTVQVNKKLADKINSVTYRDTAGTKGRLVTKNLNNGYVQYIYKRDYGYDKGSTTPNGNLGKAVEFTFNLKNMLDSDDQLSSYYYNDTIKPQMWPGGGKDHLLQHSFIQYKNEQEHLLSIYNKVVELKGQSKITELREKIKNFSNIYNNLKEDPETDKKIINPDTHRKLDKIKKDIDSHYSSTLELLSNLPNFYKNNKQRTTKKDELLEDLQGRVGNHQYNGLKGRIDALPGYDVNDRNDNSIIDETDVKNAENKVNEIKRKHSELQEKIEKAKKQNRINNHNELINQYESLKASIQEAKNLISQIPEFDDVYQDGQSFNQKRQGLTNSLPNLSELNLPVAPPTQKVELSNLDGLSREQKEQVKDNLKANNPELDLSKVTVAADGTVTVQWDEHNSVTVDKSETVELKVNKDALQQAIEKTRKTTNSEFYNKLEELDPNLKSEYDKAKQQAEITFNNNKASQTEVNKATNKLNELESKISEREQIEVTKKFNQAKAKVEEAKQAVQTAQAKKEEIERDGVVNPSEVAELNALNDA
ncbi:YSIRK-type signal peptide-containing protein, partial [Dolosigranulum pigrum]